jgi:hypothetical protein
MAFLVAWRWAASCLKPRRPNTNDFRSETPGQLHENQQELERLRRGGAFRRRDEALRTNFFRAKPLSLKAPRKAYFSPRRSNLVA